MSPRSASAFVSKRLLLATSPIAAMRQLLTHAPQYRQCRQYFIGPPRRRAVRRMQNCESLASSPLSTSRSWATERHCSAALTQSFRDRIAAGSAYVQLCVIPRNLSGLALQSMCVIELTPNGRGSIASSTKSPIDNPVQPNALEVSACARKIINAPRAPATTK